MIYVMSDIHGNLRRFNSILEQIDLQAEDTLYILGDVIDRHPDGLRILRRIMGMPNAKMLLGNHELMMLQALGLGYCEHLQNGGDPAQLFGRWYRNGGQVTHQHWKHLRKSLREEIANYLASLPVNIDVTVNGIRYKLAHAEDVDTFDQAWMPVAIGIALSMRFGIGGSWKTPTPRTILWYSGTPLRGISSLGHR